MFILFHIVKPLTRIAFRRFYRKIYFHGEEHLPKDKSLILAVNHPTAFIDPVLVAGFVHPTVNTLLRGDMFKGKFISWLLRQFRLIPIFRMRDGIGNLKQNQDSLDYCMDLLHRGKHISILAEGVSEMEKRLRPVQKGTARMAFGVYDQHGQAPIAVVPVGVNYTDPSRFRTEVMIAFGPPLLVEDYLEAYQQNPRGTITKLTKDLEIAMRKLVIHIENPEDDVWVDRILEVIRHDHPTPFWPQQSKNDAQRAREYHQVEKLNALSAEDKASLRSVVDEYWQKLTNHQITDFGVVHYKRSLTGWWLLMLLGALPFLLGYVMNIGPVWLGKRFVDQKIKDPKFYTPVWFGVTFFTHIFYYLLIFIAALIIRKPWMWMLAAALPVLGQWALYYNDKYREGRSIRAVQSLPAIEQEALISARNNLNALTADLSGQS